jgi:hypothetical protein
LIEYPLIVANRYWHRVALHTQTHSHKYTHITGTEPPIIEKPLRSKSMKDVCKEKWDADFIDKIGENRQQLYDLILVRFASLALPFFSVPHIQRPQIIQLISTQVFLRVSFIFLISAGCELHGHQGVAAPWLRKGGEFDQG